MWRLPLGLGPNQYGIAVSPVSDGANIFAADARGVLFAMDALTGRVKWSADGSANITALVMAGGNLIVGTFPNTVSALAPGTGATVWSITVPTMQQMQFQIGALAAVANNRNILVTNGGWPMFALVSAADGHLVTTMMIPVNGFNIDTILNTDKYFLIADDKMPMPPGGNYTERTFTVMDLASGATLCNFTHIKNHSNTISSESIGLGGDLFLAVVPHFWPNNTLKNFSATWHSISGGCQQVGTSDPHLEAFPGPHGGQHLYSILPQCDRAGGPPCNNASRVVGWTLAQLEQRAPGATPTAKWSTNLGKIVNEGGDAFLSGTPFTGAALVINLGNSILAVNSSTGSAFWSLDLPVPTAPTASAVGAFINPMGEHTLFIPNLEGWTLVKLNKQTGTATVLDRNVHTPITGSTSFSIGDTTFVTVVELSGGDIVALKLAA